MPRFAIPPLLLGLIVLTLAACGRGEVEPRSACDGLVVTEEGLTRDAYLPCAGEILAAMDALRPEIEAALDGDKEAGRRARRAYRALRKLVKKAGGKDLLEQWRDRRLTRLNEHIWNAYRNYWRSTISPTHAEIQAAEASHDRARRIYDAF